MNEIQRKFLISADITRWLKEQQYSLDKTEQFYVQSDTDMKCYYFKSFPSKYTKVIVDDEGKEKHQVVSEEEYVLKRKKHIGRKIVKKSYTLDDDGQFFVFFEYLKKYKGLYILIASFEDSKIMRESKTLDALQPFVLKKINKDSKYTDESLALCVKPIEYNLNKLFDQIDAYEPANLFFWQVPQRIYVRDGVALILYKNLRLLQHYKVNYQTRRFSASLHRLRVIMRRTATLLEAFSSFFNPNVQRFCSEFFLRYHEQTKLLRYLYFLEELYATCEDTKITLHSELKRLISEEHHNVAQMFLSQPFVQLIQILTREIQEPNTMHCKALKKEVKKVVGERLGAFEVLLQQTKEGYDEELLEKIYASMDSLQTLIEDFFQIIGEKETKVIVEELNILLKPLRDYKNCKERERILDAIVEQSEETISLEDNPLLCDTKTMEALEEKIANALRLLRSSTFYV